MVTEAEARLCDRYRRGRTYRRGRGKNLGIISVMSRSDVVRLGTLRLLKEMVTKKTIYVPELSRAETRRDICIAGVFTESEIDQITDYQESTGMTFSNILRQGMLDFIES